MQVDSSSLALGSLHTESDYLAIEERLEISRTIVAADGGQMPQDTVDITDPKALLVKWLYETLTGHKAPPIARLQGGGSARAAEVRSNPQWSISYSRREIHRETESSSFTAEGSVTLKSGKKIDFSLKLEMSRELTEINTLSFRAGNMSDPIVVNLDGAGVRLTGERQAFDLEGDGVDETIASLAAGSAWLARDTNGNGNVDSGRELFGPVSGDGFSELAALDGDSNGWIDEGDSAYALLGLWNMGRFMSLRDAGIGALSTDSISTPFALKQDAELIGQVRDTAVYLREDGTPGALQQIDFVA